MKVVSVDIRPAYGAGRCSKWLIYGLGLVLLALPLGIAQGQDSEPEFVVVVHTSNGVASMDRKRVSKIFLKQLKRWPEEPGPKSSDQKEPVETRPVDQKAGAAVRESFTREIHGKKMSAIESYWQRMIFSGRDVPPDELPGDSEVLAFVRLDPGAIGYVSAGADLGPDVKVLEITD